MYEPLTGELRDVYNARKKFNRRGLYQIKNSDLGWHVTGAGGMLVTEFCDSELLALNEAVKLIDEANESKQKPAWFFGR